MKYIILLVSMLAITGCSKSAPKCSDSETLKLLRGTIEDQYAMFPVFQGTPMQIEISSIRTLNSENGINSCGAEIKVSSDKLNRMPNKELFQKIFNKYIEYKSGLNDNGSHYVTTYFN